MYYSYYQLKEKEPWKITTDTQKDLKEIEKIGAKRRSILSISQPIEDDTDQSKILYKGPFYVDIDNADIAASLESAREFYEKLKSWDVPMESVGVYASGKKGFHFILHESLFMPSSRGVKYLPVIYKFMALHMFVPGLDTQVYCAGKGNLFRIENVQREDGRYKVRLHPQELDTLDPAQYQALTSQPRTNLTLMPIQPAKTVNSGLVRAFHIGKERWKVAEKTRQTKGIPDQLLVPFKDSPPLCISQLAEYKLRSSVNFNDASLQMAIFLARSSSSLQTINSLKSLMVSRASSNSYPSDRDKDRHLLAQLAFATSQPKYQFSCSVMRSILSSRPCENCPIHDKKQDELERYEIEERADGYYAVTENGQARRLTSFTLVPTKEICSHDSATERRRSHVLATVESNHEYIGQARIEESQWNSRSGFLTAVQGLHNLKVIASDNDIQNLKHYILRDRENLDQQEEVTAVGVHRVMRYGKPRYTYVEQGLSVNKWGVPNTHILSSPVDQSHSALPNLKHVSITQPGDAQTLEVVQHLIRMNLPSVVAPILGWLSACHLKSHFMGLYSQFPVLNLWGGAGSGKTKTMSVFCHLSGCDYLTFAPPALTSLTEFPVISTCTSTTTVPRVLDEFNKGGMRYNTYRHYGEIFKQAFNNSPVMRGRLSKKTEVVKGPMGAVADSFYMTSPISLLSEHGPNLPALVDRMYSTMLMQPSLHTRRPHMLAAVRGKNRLIQLAKALMTRALSLREDWIETQMNAWAQVIPAAYTERQQYCRQVIGVGLDFFEEVLNKSLKLDVSQDLQMLKGEFVLANQDPAALAGISHATEVDRLMVYLTELVMLTKQQATSLPVTPAMMQVRGTQLFLDIPMVYTYLQMYLRQLGEPMPITSVSQFSALMRSEPYFIDDSMIEASMVQFRPVTRLDLTKMQQRGINPQLFS